MFEHPALESSTACSKCAFERAPTGAEQPEADVLMVGWALVRSVDHAFGTTTTLEGLEERIQEFENAAREALEQADNAAEAASYLQRLEAQYDENPPAGSKFDVDVPSDLPSSEDLLEDLDDFLRRTRGTNE